MAWCKLDDTVPHHPKHLKVGAEASWMWFCAIAYSQRHLTDGFIPSEALPLLGAFRRPDELADRLVKVGLFDVVEGGIAVHDYHDHNATADEARARLARISEERQRAGRSGGLRAAAKREANGQAKAKQTDHGLLDDGASKPVAIRPKQTASPIPSHIDPPNPPSGGNWVTDDVTTQNAAAFLEAYPEVYAKCRHGATILMREARDFPAAVELVTAWPDPAHLTSMLRLFLLKKDWAPKNEPGTIRQFAHLAPQCDSLLRAARTA